MKKYPRQNFRLPAQALPLPYPQTPQSAFALVRARGLCMAEISRATGISRHTFNDLLTGKQKGLRGNAHRAAVLLGLKPTPEKAASTTSPQIKGSAELAHARIEAQFSALMEGHQK